MKKIVSALLLVPFLLAGSGCARHGSLQQKTRWYKHHKSSHLPCPCEGH